MVVVGLHEVGSPGATHLCQAIRHVGDVNSRNQRGWTQIGNTASLLRRSRSLEILRPSRTQNRELHFDGPVCSLGRCGALVSRSVARRVRSFVQDGRTPGMLVCPGCMRILILLFGSSVLVSWSVAQHEWDPHA